MIIRKTTDLTAPASGVPFNFSIARMIVICGLKNQAFF